MARKKVSENLFDFEKCRDAKAKIRTKGEPTPEERAANKLKEANEVPATKELEEEAKKEIMIEEIMEGLAQGGEEQGFEISPELIQDLQDFAKDLDEGDTWSEEMAEDAKLRKSEEKIKRKKK